MLLNLIVSCHLATKTEDNPETINRMGKLSISNHKSLKSVAFPVYSTFCTINMQHRQSTRQQPLDAVPQKKNPAQFKC